jgi:hypothetical protein
MAFYNANIMPAVAIVLCNKNSEALTSLKAPCCWIQWGKDRRRLTMIDVGYTRGNAEKMSKLRRIEIIRR